MSLPLVLAGFAIILSLAGAAAAMYYIFSNQRRKAKRNLRVFEGFALVYFIFLYGAIILDAEYAAPKYGISSRVGAIVLLCLLIAEIAADAWRAGKYDS